MSEFRACCKWKHKIWRGPWRCWESQLENDLLIHFREVHPKWDKEKRWKRVKKALKNIHNHKKA